MRKRVVALSGVLVVAAAAYAPLVVVSTEEAFSSSAIKDCMKVIDRAGVDRSKFRVMEASTSFAVEPYASQAPRSDEAEQAVSERAGSPALLGVFLTIRTDGRDAAASCDYSAAKAGLGYEGVKLGLVTLDYLPVESEAIARWPIFSTGYLDRWRFFQPIDALVVKHD